MTSSPSPYLFSGDKNRISCPGFIESCPWTSTRCCSWHSTNVSWSRSRTSSTSTGLSSIATLLPVPLRCKLLIQVGQWTTTIGSLFVWRVGRVHGRRRGLPVGRRVRLVCRWDLWTVQRRFLFDVQFRAFKLLVLFRGGFLDCWNSSGFDQLEGKELVKWLIGIV